MARPKKSTVTRRATGKKNVSSSNEPLTVEQVWDVFKFAQSIYQGVGGYYTPDMVNARLKDVTLSPLAATSAGITEALAAPKDNEQKLIGYSEFMELNSMLYKRVLLYFSGLMAFDWNYVCVNAEDDDYTKPAFKKDLRIVQEFFDCFDVKQEFRTALKQMLRQEGYFAIFRDDGERFTMQELPQQYCKVTGRWERGLLFDFNMYWFLNPAVKLEMYPDVFTSLYNAVFEGKTKPPYDPAADINDRTGTFVYWAQTEPQDGFVAFKLFPEIGTMIPLLAPLLPDAVLQPVIRELQTNSYIQEASKVIFGQVEFLKDAQSKVKDALTIAPETLGKFLALIQAGLPSAVKVAAAPLANTTALEFKGNTEIYDSYLKASSSSSGVNSRLIYSFDRQNVLETKLSMDIDENILRPVYAQFERMLEYWVNRRTKKYKFRFMFEGFNTSTDRAERMDGVMKLADSGIVLEQKIASAYGLSPFDFRRLMAETKANGFVKRLTPILKSNQMGGAAGAGRPAKADGDLSDKGSETRESGANDEKAEE